MTEQAVERDIRFIIITGLSGAGKTETTHFLEDLGFFCVDNLPPALIPKFADLCRQSGGNIRRVAVVVDIRGGEFFEETRSVLQELEKQGFGYQILFLEASEDTLVKRFKETRRRHPLAPEGRVLEGIRREQHLLESLRGRATWIVDTTGSAPSELKERLRDLFVEKDDPPLIIHVVSFGFKHGLPLDADLVIDVRFLPNPHYVESLQPLTGNHPEVKDYVLHWPVAEQLMNHLTGLVDFLLPHYISEGKSQLTIAIGCTGGRHRSVVIGNRLAEVIRDRAFTVGVEHRDIERADSEEVKEAEQIHIRAAERDGAGTEDPA